MPQGAILYRWGQVVPGREKLSMDLFRENVALLDELQKNNQIIGHYPYISTNRDGGYWLVHGEMDQLGALQAMPEVAALLFKAQMTLTDWTAEWLAGGSAEELAEPMALAEQIINQHD